jgi:hypothetical protein
MSARHTNTVYKVDENTGAIEWRFGGERSDFTFPSQAQMPSFQHDARRMPDGRISVFDNGNEHRPQVSRGSVYEVDENAMTAELSESLQSDPPVYAFAMGSNRHLPNGNQLVSYGETGEIAEFADGERVFTGSFNDTWLSYRAERADWHATPGTRPDAALRHGTMYMSWNGATEVRRWRVEAGPSEDELTTVGVTRDAGFETAAEISPPEDATVYRVTALGLLGKPLGSRTLTP